MVSALRACRIGAPLSQSCVWRPESCGKFGFLHSSRTMFRSRILGLDYGSCIEPLTAPVHPSAPRLLHSGLQLPADDSPSTVAASATRRGLSPSATSAYVHIPFCRRRCHYCDFPIVAVGLDAGNKQHIESNMASYVDLVCREICITSKAYERHPLKTVFFGGGTPSLLPPPMLYRIMECLHHNFGIESGAEVSIEMDPGTFDERSLQLLLQAGITRVSLGVQCFQEDLLRKCGRAHGLEEIYEAIKIIRSSSLNNWSLDLISSLPTQTTELWVHTLEQALKSQPAHISVYDLQIEKGTQFSKWYKAGKSPLPSDEKSAELYRIACKMISDAGFEHYEISNYAKPGFYCKHNIVYWLNLPYHAFGLGSTSYVDRMRFPRPRRMQDYVAFVDRLDVSMVQTLCSQDLMEDNFLDTVMLSLRLARGLDVQELLSIYGSELVLIMLEGLLPFVKRGYVLVLDGYRKPLSVNTFAHINGDSKQKRSTATLGRDAGSKSLQFARHASSGLERVGFVRLSDPEGFLFSNEIISSVFLAVHGFSFPS